MVHRRMRDRAFREDQERGLRLPHVAAVNALVDRLRDPTGKGWMPYVAPIYGGIHAELLNLFRDPGPMTNAANGGSGFLCLENDDPAAELFASLLDEAGIPSHMVITWNAYPWYINRKPRAAEIDAGVEPLRELLKLLPRLQVVMLNGGDAKVLWRRFTRKREPPDVAVLETYHTGRQAFIGTPEVRAARMADLRENFSEAARILGSDHPQTPAGEPDS